MNCNTHIVVTESGLEEGHPGAGVGVEHGRLHLRMSLVEEVKRLREAAEDDRIDNAKGEHVASYHRVNHRHKGTRQAYGAAKEKQENEWPGRD